MQTIDSYRISKVLGKGSYGITYLGYDTVNEKNVAIKVIDIERSRRMGSDVDKINDEINSLKYLSQLRGSEHMAKYIDSFAGKINEVDVIFIISEYIEGESLYQYIKERQDAIPPMELWAIMGQLINGLKFIHNNNFAHRDIKPDNILLTRNNGTKIIKYIDFGFACTDKCRFQKCTNICKEPIGGTSYYMAPEIFNGTYSPTLEGAKAHDIWSLAIVFHELCDGPGAYPFEVQIGGRKLTNAEIARNIMSIPTFTVDYDLDGDHRTRDFLVSMLVVNWKNRPTIDEVLHKFQSDVVFRLSVKQETKVPNGKIFPLEREAPPKLDKPLSTLESGSTILRSAVIPETSSESVKILEPSPRRSVIDMGSEDSIYKRNSFIDYPKRGGRFQTDYLNNE